MAEIIKQQGFKQKSSLKHVKTRTPYRVVEQYEKQFKYQFGEDLGQMATEFMKVATKHLSDTKGQVQK